MPHPYKGATCRGSYLLGTACGKCERCMDEFAAVNRKLNFWRPAKTAPENKPVLVWHPGLGMGGWNVMYRRGDEWTETANDGRTLKSGYEPSHWMPLPEPPANGPASQPPEQQ